MLFRDAMLLIVSRAEVRFETTEPLDVLKERLRALPDERFSPDVAKKAVKATGHVFLCPVSELDQVIELPDLVHTIGDQLLDMATAVSASHDDLFSAAVFTAIGIFMGNYLHCAHPDSFVGVFFPHELLDLILERRKESVDADKVNDTASAERLREALRNMRPEDFGATQLPPHR